MAKMGRVSGFWRFLGKYLGTEQKLPYWEPTGETPWISGPEYIRTLKRMHPCYLNRVFAGRFPVISFSTDIDFRHGENVAAGRSTFGSRGGPMGTKLAHVQFNSSRSNFTQRMSVDLLRYHPLPCWKFGVPMTHPTGHWYHPLPSEIKRPSPWKDRSWWVESNMCKFGAHRTSSTTKSGTPRGDIFAMAKMGRVSGFLRFLGKNLGTGQKFPYWELTGENPWISVPEDIPTLRPKPAPAKFLIF